MSATLCEASSYSLCITQIGLHPSLTHCTESSHAMLHRHQSTRPTPTLSVCRNPSDLTPVPLLPSPLPLRAHNKFAYISRFWPSNCFVVSLAQVTPPAPSPPRLFLSLSSRPSANGQPPSQRSSRCSASLTSSLQCRTTCHTSLRPTLVHHGESSAVHNELHSGTDRLIISPSQVNLSQLLILSEVGHHAPSRQEMSTHDFWELCSTH